MDGKQAFLFKLYPQYKDKADENNLKAASIRLADDVHHLTLMIINKVLEKRYMEKVKMSVVKAYFEANQNLLMILETFTEHLRKSGVEISSEQLQSTEKIREQMEIIQKGVGEILKD